MGLGDSIREVLSPGGDNESSQNQPTEDSSAPEGFYDDMDEGDYQAAAGRVEDQDLVGHAAEYALDRAETAEDYVDVADALAEHSGNMSGLADLAADNLPGFEDETVQKAQQAAEGAEETYQQAYEHALNVVNAAEFASTAAEFPNTEIEVGDRKNLHMAQNKASRAINEVESQAQELGFEDQLE